MSAVPLVPPVEEDLLRFAVDIAREAGELTLGWFRKDGLVVEGKDDGTPVTIADRSAERLLRERIAAAFPDDSVVGEEESDTVGTSGRTWVLDPIDGTQSFVHGVPLYGNLVSLEDEHGPAIGVVNIPGLDECVWAGRGRGCFVDDRPTGVSDHAGIAGACLVTSGVDYWLSADRLQPFIQQGTVIRTWGDAYGYVLVATGRADAMVDPIVSRWDVAPFLTILPEAGGVFSDFTGTVTADGGNAMAANPTLHAELVDLLAT
ncbi:MAG: hypothetical protein CL441_04600 [Acidimicrobiaceae bacterium]|jgi:histidinol phosphatase-like enzyme (inositol monophosphatase family)|nr:hypothetical protein [Acidimicrobiaceae bacterium]